MSSPFSGGLCRSLNERSFSLLRDSVSTRGRMSLPFCNATRCLTPSVNPDVRSGGFRRPDSSSKRSGIQCGEHSGWIPVNDSEQRASRRFGGPPPALPVLDGIQAEPKRVRESGLCHAKSIADRFYVNLPGHMRPESFLLPSKKSLNVVKAIHHLLELRFHATSRKSRKHYRHVSSARCVPPSTGFLSHSLEKP